MGMTLAQKFVAAVKSKSDYTITEDLSSVKI